MNEVIKDLAEQATDKWWGDQFFDKEKFAELIVRECLYNMENCDGDLDFAIWKTKQDFGVKE